MNKIGKYLAGAALALSLVTAEAQVPFAREFLNGWAMYIPTNGTVNFGDTNVMYASAANTNLIFSLTNVYFLPYLTGNSYANWWTNTILTNPFVTFPRAWEDIPIPADRNGKVMDNLALTIALRGTNATCTNIMTLTFCGVASGGRQYLNNSPVGAGAIAPNFALAETGTGTAQFPVAITPNGNTYVVARTNLPSGLLQGCTVLRLLKVVANQVASPTLGTYIDSIALEGFQP